MVKKIKMRPITSVIAVVLVVAIIAGNLLLNQFSYVVNQALAGDTTDYGSAGAELQAGDEIVQTLGEESMVLLKNEDNFLPIEKEQKVNLFGWAATDQGFLLVGGGSGGTVIAAQNRVTLTTALDREGLSYNKELLDAYSAVSSADADANSNSPDSMRSGQSGCLLLHRGAYAAGQGVLRYRHCGAQPLLWRERQPDRADRHRHLFQRHLPGADRT